jgi:hypothetical protein
MMNEFLKRKNIKINTFGKTNSNVSFDKDFNKLEYTKEGNK